MAYLGFPFGGGVKIFLEKWGYLHACSPENFLRNGAIWCVLENILLKFCEKKCKVNIYFYIKTMDNALLRTLYLGVLEHTPRFLVNCAIWCVLKHIFREHSLKKIYIKLNNIDMLQLYRYGVFLE